MAIAQETLEQLRTAGLTDVDPEIADLLGQELERQRGQIELIASENFTWPAVFEAVGSTPAEFEQWLKREFERWGRVVREGKVTQ